MAVSTSISLWSVSHLSLIKQSEKVCSWKKSKIGFKFTNLWGLKKKKKSDPETDEKKICFLTHADFLFFWTFPISPLTQVSAEGGKPAPLGSAWNPCSFGSTSDEEKTKSFQLSPNSDLQYLSWTLCWAKPTTRKHKQAKASALEGLVLFFSVHCSFTEAQCLH